MLIGANETHLIKSMLKYQGSFGKPVFYNRVPKCASGTVAQVLSSVARRNNFEWISSSNYGQSHIRGNLQVNLALHIFCCTKASNVLHSWKRYYALCILILLAHNIYSMEHV